MRVCFIVAALDRSGGANIIHTYATRLARRGHEVHVVGRPPAIPTWREQLRSIRYSGTLLRKNLNQDTAYVGGDYRLHIIESYRPIRASDIPASDAIVATWWETAEWLGTMPASKGKKFHLVQGYEVFHYTDERRVHAALQLPTIKIAVSSWLKEIMQEKLGICDAEVIPNSVDCSCFYSDGRKRRSSPVIGMIVSPIPEKNCAVGFEAITAAQRVIPDLQVILIDPEGVVERPPGATRLLGYVEQHRLREVYSACDAWLWPSIAEGFGLPILEAMACGTPVVATRAGASTDLISDGLNGIVVDGFDHESLTAGIQRLLNQSELEWRKMSDAAHDAAHRYSWDEATDRFEAVLSKALAEGGR